MRWGASVAELEQALAGRCTRFEKRPAEAAGQLRIDCEGLSFRYRPRHMEFLFRDGRLVLATVRVQADEQEAILRDMRRTLGAPTRTNGRWLAFESHRTAWRFATAEILFYSPQLDREAAGWFN
jgi:hypothetical protein